MRWEPGQTSDNIEDRRDEDSSGGGGGGGFVPGGGIRLGLGGTVVVLALSLLFGRNFFADLGATPGVGSPQVAPGARPGAPGAPGVRRPRSDEDQHLVEFVSFVLDDIQNHWKRELPTQGRVQYQDSKLVLFSNGIRSGCGFAETQMGPFYCPGDKKVYIDLGFYRELRTRFGAPGEFAEAYVIAHEIGHHVQDLLGIEAAFRRKQAQNPGAANRLSVRMELQADCLAGVWGFSAQHRGLLEPGDLESGLTAAAAVGDDRLQKQATGQVHPEKWTHGSSAERVAWFKRGFSTGRIDSCDTFNQPDPTN